MPQSTVTPDTAARDIAEMRIARDRDGEYCICPSAARIKWGAWAGWRQENKKGDQQATLLCSYWVRKHFPSLRCMEPGAKPRRVRITMKLVD